MKSKWFILVTFVCLSSFLASFAFASQWVRIYGGANLDQATSIQQATDGGYIVVGMTNSFGAGNSDVWVLKLDSNGNILWQKTYGGTEFEYARSIQQTADGGYILVGGTLSSGDENSDLLIIKLDGNGNVQWKKTYGGMDLESAYSVKQTSDNGYIISGDTRSFGAGSYDAWVLKLDESGNIQWQKTYGGGGSDSAYSIEQTSDNGYVVAGMTYSFGVGDYDAWVLKLDGNGNIQWANTYGGMKWDEAWSIHQTSDGGYIMAGESISFSKSFNAWILKLNSNGGIAWQRTYGGMSSANAYSVQQTIDGGYIIAGETTYLGEGEDLFVLKLDEHGDIPGCSLESTSDATVNSIEFSGVDANAISNFSKALENVPSITINDTNANMTELCFYEEIPSYKITVMKSGSGSGTVNATGCTLSWNGNTGTCTANRDTQVTLSAQANIDSTFAGWSDGTGSASGCTGTGDCIFTITQDSSITATFTLTPPTHYTLTVTKTGTGNGTITSSPSGLINCGSDCEELFPIGGRPKKVTLRVRPDASSTFLGWGGDCSSRGKKTTCTLVMDSNKVVSAEFGVSDIVVTPDTYDFGDVRVREASEPVTFTVMNNGTGILKISRLKVSGIDARMFKIKGGIKKTLGAGGSFQFTLTFKPISVGGKSAYIEIRSNDPDTPVLNIPISGNGV